MSACRKSAVGAKIACRVSADVILDHADYYFDSRDERVKSIILTNIKSAILKQSAKDGCFPEDYASTLSFVCYNKNSGQILTFSLGDSRIYRAGPGCAEYVNRTRAHEHGNVCSVVSYGAENEATLGRSVARKDESYILCTDGMWKTAEAACLFSFPDSVFDCANAARYLERCRISDDCSFLFAD